MASILTTLLHGSSEMMKFSKIFFTGIGKQKGFSDLKECESGNGERKSYKVFFFLIYIILYFDAKSLENFWV